MSLPSERYHFGVRIRILTVIVCFGTVLSACGFQPVYRAGPGTDNVPAALRAVHVVEATDRLGQVLRNELLFLFGQNRSTRRDEATYVLSIGAASTSVGSIVSRTGVTSARLYKLDVTYRLLDAETEEELFRGRTSSQAAYDILDQQYANLRAERDAEDRVAKDAARKINDQIAGYFATRP